MSKTVSELMEFAEAYAQCGTRNHERYRARLEHALRAVVEDAERWRNYVNRFNDDAARTKGEPQ